MRVVVGVTGGIAAYKAASVIRLLVKAGHEVHAVPTASALRFIGTPTLEALSRNPVSSEVFDDVAEVRHVALGQSADLIIIAPATANSIAKLAGGHSDDLLGTTVLASTAPVVIAPAMHTEMWQNPATQHNISVLQNRGVHIVGPDSGALTGHDVGPGRMSEPDEIVEAALAVVEGADARLAGRRVVVSAGGTREPIDPVRFIGNRSSGAMGAALARAAAERGADVTLVGANLEVPVPDGVRHVAVESAEELHAAMLEHVDADLVIMAAAVSDYRVVDASDRKRKKEAWGDSPTLALAENPDILVDLASRAKGVVVGFAAESETDPDELREVGRAKLERKGCDFLVVNSVSADTGFGAVDTSVIVLARGGSEAASASGDKVSVARAIIEATTKEHV
ncbi:bifunctional phosphopantothenoylcysteine decarboxylase/phosphopantothenate--cysteine ligase CoaBC [Agrococcus casei]|uniref:bifunctional phosphopantothenoylcysteine decarboxylase/phosphopantothenate--cysteine ligase CoaBC n=1 Tax=Agrococcus casei TaxID=343512 RepID=UPI003F90FB74